MEQVSKKRMLSGIKPTGKLTLGNYIGAIKQFITYQDEYEMFVFIADLHALTLPIDAKELRQNTKDLIAIYLACGLDPEKVVLNKVMFMNMLNLDILWLVVLIWVNYLE